MPEVDGWSRAEAMKTSAGFSQVARHTAATLLSRFIMKTIAFLSLCASASAFAPLPLHAARNSALNMAESVEGPGKINGLIDLDSPKVVNNEYVCKGNAKY